VLGFPLVDVVGLLITHPPLVHFEKLCCFWSSAVFES